MPESNFCTQCGASLESGAAFCNKCGLKVGSADPAAGGSTPSKSNKSAITALLLCLFLGPLGIHRFYVGKIGTGILMILTLGGFGIWVLVDLIFIASCEFKDAKGNVLIFTRGKGSMAKRVFTIIGLILASLVLYVSIILSIVLYATGDMVEAVQEELSAIRMGDINKAYSYTSIEFQKATSLEDFEKFLDQAPSVKNNVSASIPNRKIENNVGTVTANITSTDGKVTTVEFQLVKENDKWKIINIHVLPSSGVIQPDNGGADQ